MEHVFTIAALWLGLAVLSAMVLHSDDVHRVDIRNDFGIVWIFA
jgi:hypothetical protein